MNRRTPKWVASRTVFNCTRLVALVTVGTACFSSAAHGASAPGSASQATEPSDRLSFVPGGVSLGTTAGTAEAPLVPAGNVKMRDDSFAPVGQNTKSGEWLIAPVPSLNPAMGWMLGLPVVRLYRPAGVEENDPAWMTGIGGFYAENGSWGGGIFHKMNLAGDRWRLMGAAFLSDINYDYYGIGSGPDSGRPAVPLRQDAAGGLGEVLYAVAGDLYAGLRVTRMGTTVRVAGLSDEIPPELRPPDLGVHLTLVTIAPRLKFDTRDDEFYPTSGNLIEAEVQVSSKSFGSDVDYQRYEFTWNHYRALSATSVLALRMAGKYTSGDAPFFIYPSFGQGADLRGYTAGTYRDRLLLAVQAEYRLRVRERVGVVVFAGVGSVGPSLGDLDRALPSVGAGLRYVLAPENNISLRVDVAWGRNDQQFYVGIGEAF